MKVVILGGGIGGQVASNLVGRGLGKNHDIVLIDKNSQYSFAPSFLWVAMGWREPAQITRNMGRLGKKNVKYVNAEVTKIAPADRTVETSAGKFAYDYLVIALGSDLDTETIPGFSKSAFHVYSLEAAMQFREQIRRFSGGNVAIGISSLPFKCPAAPYETAFLLDYYFRQRKLRDKVELQFFTPESLPMPVAGPVVGNAVKQVLEARQIKYHTNVKLASIDEERRKVIFEGQTGMDFDLLFAVPPHRAPRVVRESGLTGETGWISVNSKTFRTSYDDVYAVGDVTSIRLANGKMLPKAGVFAHGQSSVVAHNILSEIKHYGERKEWKGDGSCFIETGFGKAAMAKGNFYAEPDPTVNIRWPRISRAWHWYKILFEKYWLSRWF
jgi:sulfide:quinone oxidoreductase